MGCIGNLIDGNNAVDEYIATKQDENIPPWMIKKSKGD